MLPPRCAAPSRRANSEIGDVVDADPTSEGMGTTITAILFGEDETCLLHIGDSRGYVLRDGQLRQLTRDDTYVQSLVDDGLITAEAARHHPHKSLITASVQGRTFSASLTSLRDAQRRSAPALLRRPFRHRHRRGHRRGAASRDTSVRRAPSGWSSSRLQAGAPDNVTVVLADLS